MVVRRATHSGSWYTSNGQELSRELDHWLQKAGPVEKPARAIIGK
jgi:predicted class III extradiol MEMO1 family dioxygenase